MLRMNRRQFAVSMAGVLAAIVPAWRVVASADLPPGHRPIEPIGPPKVTPAMKVSLTGQVGDVEFFSGKTEKFRLHARPKPGVLASKAKVVEFPTDVIAKLPAGELTIDGVALSDEKSLHELALEIDDLHCPGLGAASKREYHSLIRAGLASGDGPGMWLRVDQGPSIWLEKVARCNITRSSASDAGQRWGEVFVLARTAARVD